MERTPPITVRRQLRRETAFGCPVAECGNPYLEYHHFDPPWRERQHHDPSGMVALCAEHHKKADAGAFTREQLQDLKNSPADNVRGRFDWLRNRLLAVVGGNFYYETPTIVQFRGEKAIGFNRDDGGRLLLNLRMVTSSQEPRLRLDDNDWIVRGAPVDFESPSGRRIHGQYANGDMLRVEFLELATVEQACERYSNVSQEQWTYVGFPITTVEIQQQIGGTGIGFGPDWTTLPGMQMSGCFAIGSSVGLSWS